MSIEQPNAPTRLETRSERTQRLVIALLALGALLSVAGDQTATIALTLRATERHFGVLVSLLFIAELLPGVLLGALGGRFVDRHDLRRVLVTALIAQGLVIGTASLAPGLWVKAVFVAVTYCFGVLAAAASFRLRKSLFGDKTHRLNGLLGSASSVGSIAGTALAGVGLAGLGLRLLLVLDAGTFLALALAMAATTAIVWTTRTAAAPPGSRAVPQAFSPR